MKFLERHPLPWVAEDQTWCDAYFVRDANKATVVIIAAMDETVETKADERTGDVVRIVTKRPKPGAYQLAKTIAALPRLMAAVTDAHAFLTGGADDGGIEERLENLIEELA